ncbi:MAG: hypothetical protein ACJAQ1_000309 [Flavobacterium sp.]|jgi:hypothetical protein
MQEILVYICVAVAVGFLIKKFFLKKKKKTKGKNCDTDCGCH